MLYASQSINLDVFLKHALYTVYALKNSLTCLLVHFLLELIHKQQHRVLVGVTMQVKYGNDCKSGGQSQSVFVRITSQAKTQRPSHVRVNILSVTLHSNGPLFTNATKRNPQTSSVWRASLNPVKPLLSVSFFAPSMIMDFLLEQTERDRSSTHQPFSHYQDY